MLPPSPDQPLIRLVVEQDLCIACGACVAACPRANIRPIFQRGRGAEEIEVIAEATCTGCPQPCDAVCPSLTVDFARQRAARTGETERVPPPARDGWMESVHLGWSPVFQDDAAASSGGILRALVAHALTTGTPVVCLARDPAGGAFRPRLLTTPGQLPDVPGSIYHSTSFAEAIAEIRQAPAPVLLVAIPCQLAGILNFVAHQEPALGRKIGLVCGLVCGWMYSFHALWAFAGHKGIARPDFAATTYRGGDRVGPLRLVQDGVVHAFPRREFATRREALDYRSSFSTDFNRQRCRVCEDHLNMGADLVTGDAWLARCAPRKLSIIGCRTARGRAALAVLEKLGHVRLEPATFADFTESQSPDLVHGTRARRTARLLREQGTPTPRFAFADAEAPVAAGLGDRIALSAEHRRRALLHAGHYRLYRWYYALRHPWMVVRFAARALLRTKKP